MFYGLKTVFEPYAKGSILYRIVFHIVGNLNYGFYSYSVKGFSDSAVGFNRYHECTGFIKK